MKKHLIWIVFTMFGTLYGQQPSDSVDPKTAKNVGDEPSRKPEKIKVTGSHIKRLDTEGASPITTITEEDIEVSGVEALGDLLRDMPSNNFGSRREKTGGNFWGEANIDLRGLGVARTLVLLNGKRIAKQAGTGAVDLNAIPLAAVERIEILRDGASAIYGTDALGGVVNIITKKALMA